MATLLFLHLQQAQQATVNHQNKNSQLKETLRKYEIEADESNKVKKQVDMKLERTSKDLEMSLMKVKEKKGTAENACC